MTATFDEENRTPVLNPSLTWIMHSLERLGNKNTSYFSLEHEYIGYVQCFGKKGKLTIEYRSYEKDGDLHFTLGRFSRKKGIQIIEGVNGNFIPIFSHEVLCLSDAKKVFTEFFAKFIQK